MGVKGLWQLLAIASRYVRLEELQTQRLAVDISLWLTQFAKIAAQKQQAPDAAAPILPLHIAGLLRRISKLLFLGIRPVFVYDGPAPSLKRRTLAVRRKRREDAANSFQRAAERLLLKRLKLSQIQKQSREGAGGKASENVPAEEAPSAPLSLEQQFWEEARAAGDSEMPPLSDDNDADGLVIPDLDQLDESALIQLPLDLQKRILRELRSRAQNQMHARILDSVVQDHHSRAMTEAILDPFRSLTALQAHTQHDSSTSEVLAAAQNVRDEPILDSFKDQTFKESRAFDEASGVSHQRQARRRNLPVVQPIPSGTPQSTLESDRDGVDIYNPHDFSSMQLDAYLESARARMKLKTLSQSIRDQSDEKSGKEGPRFILKPADQVQPHEWDSVLSDHLAKVPSHPNTTSIQDLQSSKGVSAPKFSAPVRKPAALLGKALDVKESSKGVTVSNSAKHREQKIKEEPPPVPSAASHDEGSDWHDVRNSMWRAHDGAAGQLGALPMELHKQTLASADPEGSVVGQLRASRLMKQESKAASQYLNHRSNLKKEDPTVSMRSPQPRLTPWNCRQCGHVNPPGEPCEICGLNPPNQTPATDSAIPLFSSIDPDLTRSRPILSKDPEAADVDIEDASWFSDEDEDPVVNGENSKSQPVPQPSTSVVKDPHSGSLIPEPDWEEQRRLDESRQRWESRQRQKLGKVQLRRQTLEKKQLEDTKNMAERRKRSHRVSRRAVDEEEEDLEDEESDDDFGDPMQQRADTVSSEENQHLSTEASPIPMSLLSDEEEVKSAGLISVEPPEGSEETSQLPNAGLSIGFLENSSEGLSEGMDQSGSHDSDHSSQQDSPTSQYRALMRKDESQTNESLNRSDRTAASSEVTTAQTESAEQPTLSYQPAPFLVESSGGSLPDKQLFEEQERTHQDIQTLMKATHSQKGMEAVVTKEMVQQSQSLLRLFGLPYVMSPGEAEAQCAELEKLGLVDGVITDDSDVFLFGARTVYRNMFEQKRLVEKYRMQDIEELLGLRRENLVQLAMLLGSDYTEGVLGIGAVNSMEILAAFTDFSTPDKSVESSLDKDKEPLVKFREWLYSPRRAQVEIPETRPKFNARIQKDIEEGRLEEAERPKLLQERQQHLFEFRHRNVEWHVPRNFPDLTVIKSYETPVVDRNDEKFVWGEPDLDGIRHFVEELLRRHLQQDPFHMFNPAANVGGLETQEMLDRVLYPVMQIQQGRPGSGDLVGGDNGAGLENGDTKKTNIPNRKGHKDANQTFISQYFGADMAEYLPDSGGVRSTPAESAATGFGHKGSQKLWTRSRRLRRAVQVLKSSGEVDVEALERARVAGRRRQRSHGKRSPKSPETAPQRSISKSDANESSEGTASDQTVIETPEGQEQRKRSASEAEPAVRLRRSKRIRTDATKE